MIALLLIVVSLAAPSLAQPWETLPSDPYFATYKALKAPADTQGSKALAWSVIPAQWAKPDPWALKA